jgi:hypothetical protein
MPVSPGFELGNQPGKRVFPFTHDNVIGIRDNLTPAGGRMRPADNRDTPRLRNLVAVPRFADRIQGITGDIGFRL